MKKNTENINSMSSYCLKCKKLQTILIQEFGKLKLIKQWHYQNVSYVVVKNKNPFIGDILF